MIVEIPKLLYILENLRPCTIVDASRAAGSWLMFRFRCGNTVQTDRWTIRVYSPWVVHVNDRLSVTANDSQESIDKFLKRLEGAKVLDTHIQTPAYDTTFIFTENITLRVFPVMSEVSGKAEGLYSPAWALDKIGDFIISIEPSNQIIQIPVKPTQS